jgi:hypothetical protein
MSNGVINMAKIISESQYPGQAMAERNVSSAWLSTSVMAEKPTSG